MSEGEEEAPAYFLRPGECLAVTYVIGPQVVRTVGRYVGLGSLEGNGKFIFVKDCDGTHAIRFDNVVNIISLPDKTLAKYANEENDKQKQIIYVMCTCKS